MGVFDWIKSHIPLIIFVLIIIAVVLIILWQKDIIFASSNLPAEAPPAEAPTVDPSNGSNVVVGVPGTVGPPLTVSPPETNQPPTLPTPVLDPKYKYLGCFKDTPTRALPIFSGTTTVKDCAVKARDKKSKYFGLQYGNATPGKAGECWMSNADERKYDMFGSSDRCNFFKDINDEVVAGPDSNAVYELI